MITEDMSGGLHVCELEELNDKANRLAEDLAVVQIRHHRGVIDLDERQAQWEDVSANYYTGDDNRDTLLNGFLIVALADLAAWSWLEGRATKS